MISFYAYFRSKCGTKTMKRSIYLSFQTLNHHNKGQRLRNESLMSLWYATRTIKIWIKNSVLHYFQQRATACPSLNNLKGQTSHTGSRVQRRPPHTTPVSPVPMKTAWCIPVLRCPRHPPHIPWSLRLKVMTCRRRWWTCSRVWICWEGVCQTCRIWI